MHSAKIINGKLLADEILASLKQKIAEATHKGTRPPGLCTVLVGEDPASQIYVHNKNKQAASIGIKSFHKNLSQNTSQSDLVALIHELNENPEIDGILVQLPLPAQIDPQAILEAISPNKDVDGFHPENVGLLSIGKPRFIPCTPKGCLLLAQSTGISLLGAHAVILGRSNIVGKPMTQLLLNSEATVTVCHKNTQDLKTFTRQADLLITATGSPHLIKADFVKPGAVVLDIGITRLPNGKIVGDADTEALLPIVKAITPVPGGVGPMTLAMLMENTHQAYQMST
ncbi:MAG: bifunctional methylenetetrahydrofolate dehydrogenase/methenyltetrahydrofolate cyclohydrolase FolD [Myxococcota bacterium]